ncbi:transcription factor TFIIIB component B'' homolog isoform X3 [Triplophysa dalaica]|uniref:transcription factor TFIIIB component B'' homolog isoform X3 n=1 Tax=Triplophysa dalaica TaxID=1582913 RepID=UPI0024DFCB68|nr:transcription factor TFIIIB component B'' homolog isoform X3 [Triplophysa dalaica]
MIRRSRISVRPNVKPPGRALTGSHDASLDKTQPNQTPTDSGPSQVSEVIAEQVNSDPPATESEKTSEKAAMTSNHGNDVDANSHEEGAASKSTDSQAATSTSLTSGPQRRKRFTALPNLAKPRASPVSSSTPKSPSKSPVKPVTPSESEKIAAIVESALGAPLVKEAVANSNVPERRRPSVGGRRPKAQPTPTVPPQFVLEKGTLGDRASDQQQPLETSQPDPVILHETPPECPIPAALDCKVVEPENNSGLDLEKDQYDPLRKKLNSGSKVIKTLKDPADMIRLAKARKLRELLKMEMSKSKEDRKKPRMGVKERKVPKDHTKMTMRELIYYLPASNPMKSFTEEEEKASEIVLPNSPKPTSSKPSTGPSVQENEGEDGLREDEEEADMAEETHAEDPLMVPRVKVAEDGSLIIDEESLTVQVSRMNGPNPAEDRDPIFERGSTTTYSSFKKGTYTKPWSNGETDMFYLAISMVGTDFSMIGQLFPHRARVEIKNKFKKEERINSWRIDKAFKEKRRLDLDFFKTLMEQILKDEQTKKDKNKELIKLAKAQRTFRKPRVVKRKEIRSSESSDNDEVVGEKENEDLWNEGGGICNPLRSNPHPCVVNAMLLPLSYRKAVGNAASKKRRADPQDCENEISEGLSSDERLKESENVSKSPVIKPAQLNGRPQRPIPTLSNRCGNRRPGGEETKKTTKVTPVLVQEREKKQSSILQELEDLEEEPDLTAVQEQIFNKPTRSGRIPKLSQHVMQAAAEEEEDEEVVYDPQLSTNNQGFQAPGRRAKVKPGPSLKQGMTRRGKSRLLTLRATGTEEDDDDEEDGEDCDVSSNVEEENQAFVPMSLRSLPPDNSEVLETVEELDISLNVPDILGTSQNALCPEFSCEQAEMPAGSVPCEHQLDLLVDVIEFLDPDHMEVCKEINNEAAQTLLTIGCSAQMIQTTESSCTGEDYINEQPLSDVHEEVVQDVVFTETVEIQADTSVVLAGPSVNLESETKAVLNLSSIGSDIPEPASEETYITTEQPIRIQTTNDVVTQDEMQNLSSSTSAPPSRRGRFSKPKPNVGPCLKTRRVQPQQIHQEPDSVPSSRGPNSIELNKNTTEPMQESSGPADNTPQDSSTILAVVMQPDTASDRKDGPEDIPEKDSGSVPSLKRKSDDVITEESVKKNRREVNEAEPETEQMKSVSQEERSDETSGPVRRYRGHRPKAKLTRISTDTLVQTQHNTTSTTTNETIQTQSGFSKILPEESLPVAEFFTSTFTPIESPEEGAVVTTEAQHEKVAFDTGSDMAVKEVTTQVVSGDELKQKTVAVLEENTRSTSDGNNVGELPVCLLQDTSADPTHDEPVFILSLTEIPPTFDEGMDFETETLGCTTMTELHSQSQSCNESRETSHLLITDALVPVAEEEEKGDGDNTSKGDLENTALASRSQRLDKTESPTEHPVFEKTECTEEEKERVEKKKEVPERARRAKLQVKPNTLTRRSTRGAKEETPALSSEETTSVPISTLYSQETISVQEQNLRASNSTTVKDSLTSAVTSDGEATHSSSSNIAALLKDSRQLANQENTCEDIAQGQGDLAGKDAVELSVTEASGSQSLNVSQIASVPTSGPLTRPGRRPKGFLSFISSKSTQAPSGTHRGAKPGHQKPAVNTSRPDRKREAAITVTSTKNPEAMQPSTSTSSTSKTEQNSEEEPTSVSKYFFSDIFTEVDELEDMD